MKKFTWLIILILALSWAAVACGGSTTPTEEPTSQATTVSEEEHMEEGEEHGHEELTKVSLQLQWVTQSQFAGYYAAKELGFYEKQGLDVEILEGAVDIVPQQVVAAGEAEFGVAWVPKMLASREQGADLVNIAQIFQRSGTLQVSWADSGLDSPDDWAGKRVGTWGFGNEWEVFAALRQAGIDPNDPSQVTVVQQPFDMSLLLNREIDAAQAEIYNEYAQLLEATNPETGNLYQPENFTVVNYNDVGTAMLQDHVFVREGWLAEGENVHIAEHFLAATFEGWIYCRDNMDACVDIVLKNGPTLGQGHMRWQMNEINALIWPSPQGIGVMDTALYQQTVDICLQFGVLSKAPDETAYRTDIAQAALESLEGMDITGASYQRQIVEVTPGGE